MSLTADEFDILERVVSKKELQPIFFKKVTGLKWFDALAERGFFNPSLNPKPSAASQEGYVSIPHWPAVEYLVNTAPDISIAHNEAYAIKYLDLLRLCTSDAIANNYSNYRTWWQFSKVLKYIPVHLITLDDINIVDYWLKDPYERNLVADEVGEQWLSLLLSHTDRHSHQLALRLIDLLFQIEFVPVDKKRTRKEARLLVKEWYVKKIAEKNINRAGTVLKQEIVDIFKNRLEAILSELRNDTWSSIWRAAVEDHHQNHSKDDAEDLILEAFRDSLLSWIVIDPQDAKSYVEKLLDSKFLTFKRVAIYSIENKFNELSSLVDKAILDKNFTSNLRHEMWHLLNKHFNQFTSEQQQSVLIIIKTKQVLDENNNIIESSTAYQQAIWLSALKNNTPEIYNSYTALIDKAGCEPEHPDFFSYTSAGRVRHKSPMSREVILSLDIDDLVIQLNTFEAKGGFNEPNIEGLAKEFKESVKSLPLNFHTNLTKFINSKPPYIHSLVSAYKELWTEKTQLPWDDIWINLLNFCKVIVENSNFWQAQVRPNDRGFHANADWIVSEIGRLIEAGTKSDDHAFNESLLYLAKETLLTILKYQKGEIFEKDSDAVSIAINSPRGQCIEALINLALRTCRLSHSCNKTHEVAWESFKPIFDAELEATNLGKYEFATLVTRYLPNFLYMSNNWVISNLTNIFNEANYIAWLCAMQGYAGTNVVYEQVYKFLSSNGHLVKALDDDNLKTRVNEIIVQHITVAYLHDYESLDQQSSLIAQILTRKKPSEIDQLIWYLWIQREENDTKLTAKILELWPRLIGIIDFTSIEGRKLASKLSMWAAFIDFVSDENRNFILKVAPYANEAYNSSELMENIARISVKQPDEAYKIWMRVLEKGTPDYPPDAIKTSLLNIKKSGNDGVRNAKAIASKYIAVGNDQLSQWLSDANNE